MTRKKAVKAILSNKQIEILDNICRRLDVSRSEVLRMGLMDYAKETGFINQNEMT